MPDLPDTPPQPERIGLLAGWGRYPLMVAEALVRLGHEVYCLGIKDHADPALESICHDYRPVGVAHLGVQIRYLRRHGVARATMAGKLHKTKLFQRFAILRHLPDWTCIRTFYPHFVSGKRDRKDDTLLGAVVELFASRGIAFAPATDFAPELLVKEGMISRVRLSSFEWDDIRFGWELAKKMGELDVGQSVAVKGQAVLAVEAVEGTDACIRRAGELCPAGRFTVVKVAKPQQDMRFDVPAIGIGTLQTLQAAGGRVLAVEADKTIVIDQPAVVDFANRHRIALVALPDPQALRSPIDLEAA